MGTEFIDQEPTTRNVVFDNNVSFTDPVYEGAGEISLKRGAYGKHSAFIVLRAGKHSIHTYMTREQMRHLAIVLNDLLAGNDCGYYTSHWPSDDWDQERDRLPNWINSFEDYMVYKFGPSQTVITQYPPEGLDE